ncbi:hypothetical protein ACOSQ4_012105 [Xanthoceras sorbifolium]
MIPPQTKNFLFSLKLKLGDNFTRPFCPIEARAAVSLLDVYIRGFESGIELIIGTDDMVMKLQVTKKPAMVSEWQSHESAEHKSHLLAFTFSSSVYSHPKH